MGLKFLGSPTSRLGSSPKPYVMPALEEEPYTPPPAPEPDASNFKIIETEEISGWTIALVHYPACTTYDGQKLLVYATSTDEVRAHDLLDPHFLGQEGALSPVARFEPTDRGRELARIVCMAKLKAR